jgi:hypothetical protein
VAARIDPTIKFQFQNHTIRRIIMKDSTLQSSVPKEGMAGVYFYYLISISYIFETIPVLLASLLLDKYQ